MKKKNDGTPSQDMFVEKMKAIYGEKGVFVYRLTDTKEVRGAVKASGGNAVGFAKATPSDYILTASGTMWYAEVKSTQDKTSFGFSCFTPGQWGGMKMQVAAGGQYIVYVHRLETNQWYGISALTILRAVADGKKSFKWKEMPEWL